MHSWRQRLLMLGSALLLVSAALVAFGVIPYVRADTSPGAMPERAVPAFWGNVLLVLLAAAAAVASARLGLNHPALRRVLAGVAGFLALVLGLFLIDAATAFSGHDPAMRGAVVALWGCVGLDIAAGIAMVVSAFFRRG